MTELTRKFEGLVESVTGVLDLLTKQQFNHFEKLRDMTQDDFDGYKAVDQAMTSFAEYVQEHTEMMENMSRKLDDIQNELMELKFEIKDRAE